MHVSFSLRIFASKFVTTVKKIIKKSRKTSHAYNYGFLPSLGPIWINFNYLAYVQFGCKFNFNYLGDAQFGCKCRQPTAPPMLFRGNNDRSTTAYKSPVQPTLTTNACEWPQDAGSLLQPTCIFTGIYTCIYTVCLDMRLILSTKIHSSMKIHRSQAAIYCNGRVSQVFILACIYLQQHAFFLILSMKIHSSMKIHRVNRVYGASRHTYLRLILSFKIYSSMKIHHVNREYFSQQIIRCYDQ